MAVIICMLIIFIATIIINRGFIVATWLFSVGRVATTAIVVTAGIGAVVIVISGVASRVTVILGRVGVASWGDSIYISTTTTVILWVEFLL